ncbi:AbrB family transcriptional regulator [Gemmobacter sp.]|uniref:AbrB family transcriptional regulator n=1 Tax=Gemmobacter sp. TaxID=1898957 RepID=UPI002AFE93EC|nr:AbrB family transcriptional regulator [Gemmobacter sp.]
MDDWRTGLMRGHRLRVVLATFALGGAGGLAGWAVGLPLGVLLGAMLTVAISASTRVHLFGALPGVPQHWRNAFIPIIGVAIGASFPADFLTQVLHWWPTVLAVLAFVPLAHWASYHIYRRLGRIDAPTAFFAAMPGGFIEALDMGEARGAEMQMLVMLQFLRLILCIVLVPLSFSLVTGHAVGSGSGAAMPGADLALTLQDALILTAAAVLGYVIANRLEFPAAVLSGPLLLSALAHASGLTHAVPPGWMIVITQWVVGTSLGTRFAGLDPRRLWLAMRLSVVAITISMLIAVAIAALLAGVVKEPAAAVILAFAPGGISEMALVAISLHLSAVYVTLHHLVRIVLAVLVARAGLRFLPKEPTP